ncbi:CHAT domain-containing protein [Streptomyces sp. NBC_00554]|uniref:CHAT domain-containing protein n=1 Tax=Streptomyces sp. NBC_00554 TaxID=2903661 RepID=UPI00352F4BAE|nr:CHAT domain-containing protein [Streptomyces sp. NBC_00554]
MELDRLYALPQRIAVLRGKRDGLPRIEDEVRAAGEWIACVGLGEMAGHLKELGPAVVRLELPPELADFEALPWELALVEDRPSAPHGAQPLALHGTTMVRGVGSRSEVVPRGAPVLPSRLRMLALFSLPRATATLDLGAHRTALRGKLLELAVGGQSGALPLELRTRQFGVGRSTLRGMLDEPDGWDIIHVVAHGLPGILRLEHPDGTEDQVTTQDLVELFGRARNRVRLVVLSACWSGGEVPGAGGPESADATDTPHSALTSLASAMADDLGCAVVAMRFPVGNGFALAFSTRLYTHLLRHRQALPQALHNALRETVADPELGEHRYPLFSAGAPMLYGAAAADQKLPGRPLPRTRLPGRYEGSAGPLPDRPTSFFGRLPEMVGANVALAPESGVRGAVLHGAAGMGATTCASLLAHDHREAFSTIVWHPRPEWAEEITPSRADPLADFLWHLEIRRPELAGISRDLPRTEAVARIVSLRLLLVFDAADRALARDPRLAGMIEALAAAEGPGKLLLTSRTDLPDLAPALRRVPLDPLGDAEIREIARTLPLLGPMSRTRATSRTAARVLSRTQGNPGVLYDAEAHAGVPEALDQWLLDRSA